MMGSLGSARSAIRGVGSRDKICDSAEWKNRNLIVMDPLSFIFTQRSISREAASATWP